MSIQCIVSINTSPCVKQFFFQPNLSRTQYWTIIYIVYVVILRQVVPASTPASVHNCTVSPTSPSSPNTLVLKCLPGWDGGLEQTFTLKVMEGKNFSSNRRGNGFGKQQDSISPSKGGAEEWISGGAVQYIKDQRQSSGEPAHDLGERGSGRQRGSSPEKGVLAVLAGQTSPHFTVSGLGAGQEYILQVCKGFKYCKYNFSN